ncbi:MAG: S8 family serine peptidase [Endomicrobiales bacterium]|nr:S8 family serine peptidase [Endomicrobiales bacterium]
MKKIFTIIPIIFVLLLLFSSLNAENKRKKKYRHLNSVLDELIEVYKKDKATGLKFMSMKKVPQVEEKVKVIIYPKDKNSDNVDLKVLGKYGVEYRVSKDIISAKIPVKYLEAVTKELENYVDYINLPKKAFTQAYTTEGKDLIKANLYHDNGYKGSGVKVAVIDAGFLYYNLAQINGDLPGVVTAVNYSDTSFNATDIHGTGCAEIVYDIAPEAELHLIKIDDDGDFASARDYCISNSIDVATMSLGWLNANFCDGRGSLCDTANDFRENDIFFTVSAGNQAQGHWTGTFTDVDADNWHEFSVGDEELEITTPSAGTVFYIYLTWDAFPLTSTEDYDLYVYNSSLIEVGKSIDTQDSNDEPSEAVVLTSPGQTTYKIKVKEYSTTKDSEIRIFLYNASITNSGDMVKPMSITTPADSTGTVTVAAVKYTDYNEGPQEYFSSQGPTHDSRTKPDISAPDGVETYSYRPDAFYGTSAAAPHVAGAAALLLSEDTSLSADQLEDSMMIRARDLGDSGKDNIYGNGALNLEVVFEGRALSTTEIEWYWSTGTFTGSSILGYRIYSSANELLKELSVNTSYWIETGLNNNTQYTRYFKSYNASDEFLLGNVSKYTLTNPPTNASILSDGMHAIQLDWNGNGASRFRIDRSSDSLNWETIVDSSHNLTSETYKDEGLRYSTLYYYGIYGYNGDNVLSSSATVSGKPETPSSDIQLLVSTSTVTQEQTANDSVLGDIRIQIPQGAISQDGYIIINTDAENSPKDVTSADITAANRKLTLQGIKLVESSIIEVHLYNLYGSTITTDFQDNLILTIPYIDSENDGLVDGFLPVSKVESLRIFTLQDSTWTLVSGEHTLDRTNKTVSVEIPHFSLYMLASALIPENKLDNVFVYPNPYKPATDGLYGASDFGEGVVFRNLTENVQLKIFNLAGELIKEYNKTGGNGTYFWNTRNEDNEKVASGVYLYYIVNPDNKADNATGKFAIIK